MNRKSIAKGFMYGGGCLFGGLTSIAIYCFGGLIYIGTVVIAFRVSGILSAILSAAFPVVSQIYWGIKLWSLSGIFFNFYNISLLIFVGLLVVHFSSLFLIGKAEE